jgi:hypothetical protein
MLHFQVADGGIDRESIAVSRTEAAVVFLESVVLLASLSVVLGGIELVSVRFLLGNGKLDAHGLKLSVGLGALEAKRKSEVETTENRGRVCHVSSKLVGATKSITEVCVSCLGSIGKWLKCVECSLRVTLLEISIGEEDGRVGDEDAIGMTCGEVIEESISFVTVVSLERGLGAEVIGIVIERFSGDAGLFVGSDGIWKTMVKTVGMAKSKPCGCGSFSRMGASIIKDATICSCGTGGIELLSHGAKLC